MTDNNDLSEREREILRLVATGAGNKQIAQQLGISTNTVKVHLKNIFAKIGAASRTEAAMYAVRLGLVLGNGSIEEVIKPSVVESRDVPVRWSLFLPLAVVILISLFGLILFRQTQQTQQVPVNDLSQSDLSRWHELASMPTARSGMATAIYEDQIYTIGGETAEGVTGAVEKYAPQTNTWEILSSKSVPVSDVSAGLIGGLIYLPGGRTVSGRVTDKLEIYDPLEDSWREGKSLPIALSAYALATYEGKLLIFGGWDGVSVVSTVYEYDPEEDLWYERPSMPTARMFCGAAVSRGKIFVVGGIAGTQAMDMTEVYNPHHNTMVDNPWEIKESMPSALGYVTSTSIADMIFLVGEMPDGNVGFFDYIPRSDQWEKLQSPDYLSSRAGMTAFDTYIYFFGGRDRSEYLRDNITYEAVYRILLPQSSK